QEDRIIRRGLSQCGCRALVCRAEVGWVNARSLQEFDLGGRKLAARARGGPIGKQAFGGIHDEAFEIVYCQIEPCSLEWLCTEAHRRLLMRHSLSRLLRHGVIVSMLGFRFVACALLPRNGRGLRARNSGASQAGSPPDCSPS